MVLLSNDHDLLQQHSSIKYRGNSIWFKTLSLCQSKLSCYKRVLFKAVTGKKMFTTKNRIVGCILPIGMSSLHLFIPLLMQQRISRKMKQAYTIGIHVREQPAATHRLLISISIILTSLPWLALCIYSPSHIFNL